MVSLTTHAYQNGHGVSGRAAGRPALPPPRPRPCSRRPILTAALSAWTEPRPWSRSRPVPETRRCDPTWARAIPTPRPAGRPHGTSARVTGCTSRAAPRVCSCSPRGPPGSRCGDTEGASSARRCRSRTGPASSPTAHMVQDATGRLHVLWPRIEAGRRLPQSRGIGHGHGLADRPGHRRRGLRRGADGAGPRPDGRRRLGDVGGVGGSVVDPRGGGARVALVATFTRTRTDQNGGGSRRYG